VLTERYLWKKEGKLVEDPDGLCRRVALAVAQAEAHFPNSGRAVEATARDFYDLMIDRKFLPNSPTLMNAGKNNGQQLSACFVLPVDDSMEGIFDSVKWAAIVHQSGGGTGFAFSRLRPAGSIVGSTQGVASGPVSFMKVFNEATERVKQGGTRRGANMGILRVDHPDILEFIDCKLDGGVTNFNISVAATDAFMRALAEDGEYELIAPHTKEVAGKLRAREVMERIVKAAWATGDPGMVFIDRINAGPANPTPSLGAVEATNPCVTGDTLVYTAAGLQRVKDLVDDGRPVRVATDTAAGFADASPMFPTGRKPVFRLSTVEGYEVRLTGDHLVLTARGWVPAGQLRLGDEIRLLAHKSGFGQSGSLALGRLLGWLVGDGTLTSDRAVLSFFGEAKRELAPAFAEMMASVVPNGLGIRQHYAIRAEEVAGRDEARVRSVRFWRIAAEHGLVPGDKHRVPESVFTGSEEMQRGFLQALFTADGHVSGNADKGVTVRLTSIDRSMLQDVQRLLLNFGIASRIFTDRRQEAVRRLPDGRGGYADYATRAHHDLAISKDNLHRFASELGFLSQAKQSKLVDRLAEYKSGPHPELFYAHFAALNPDGEEDVYDITEPQTHSFIGNGLTLHNCGEQPLLPFEACNLGSVNLATLAKGDDLDWAELERVTRVAVRYLDDVIEINPYPLPQIHQMVKGNRRIGVGVMGWADLLFKLGIPYDSEEALALAGRVMEFIERVGHEESAKLAEERGPFPNWSLSIYKDDRPLRNSTVTTIAPTGTISIIADCSSGIEPIFALAFIHKVGERTLRFVNPIFEQVARERGFYSEALMQKVMERGSVHDLPEVPEDVRRVFVTAHEIDPEWHVRMQAAWQKHTDNAVSKTINLPNSAGVADVQRAYQLAYDLGCLGITVFRDGSKGVQVLNVGVTEKKKEETAVAAAPAPAPAQVPGKVKPRPAIVHGHTRRMEAPEGKVYVTLNKDEEGLFEVFINVGKAGSDIAALADAVGRLISLNLRLPSTMSREARQREIITHLKGIGGSRSIGFGPNQVRSLPDAVAQALAMDLGEAPNGHAGGNGGHSAGAGNGHGDGHATGSGAATADAGTPPVGVALLNSLSVTGNLCPDCGCNSLMYEEGCKKCHVCGFSHSDPRPAHLPRRTRLPSPKSP
jgi:ribonucleoside-diphosphate reductase alpha chain